MSKINNTFDLTIKLFKSLGANVSCANGILCLENEVLLSEEQAAIIQELQTHKNLFRSFLININWESDIEGKIKENALCTEFKIEFNLYEGNCFSFYNDEYELLDILSTFLIQGERLPNNYYLINNDYRSDSCLLHPFVLKLESIFRWLNFLKGISDIDKNIKNGVSLYYFIKGENDRFATPLEIRITDIRELMLVENISPVDDVEILVTVDEHGNLHHRDKLSFFKLALVDSFRKILANETSIKPHDFILFSNLNKIKKSYYDHYDVFIQNFAIGEFQQQVEAKSFEYSEKLSNVLNDIQVRLYAIPIVLIGLSAFDKIDDFISYLFIFLGVFVTAIFNYWMVNDQVLRIDQIGKSIDFTFKKLKLKGKEGIHDNDIIMNLESVLENLTNRIRERNRKIRYYKYFCWVPMFVTILFIAYKEWDSFKLINISIPNPIIDDFYIVIFSLVKILNYFI